MNIWISKVDDTKSSEVMNDAADMSAKVIFGSPQPGLHLGRRARASARGSTVLRSEREKEHAREVWYARIRRNASIADAECNKAADDAAAEIRSAKWFAGHYSVAEGAICGQFSVAYVGRSDNGRRVSI